MLVLGRHVGEIIDIGDDIHIEVMAFRDLDRRPCVRLGITAPPHIKVHRREITERIEKESKPKRHTTTETKDGCD